MRSKLFFHYRLNFWPENGGNRYRQNTVTYPPNYTVSNPQDRDFVTLALKIFLILCVSPCRLTSNCYVTLLTLNKDLYSIAELPRGTAVIGRSLLFWIVDLI